MYICLQMDFSKVKGVKKHHFFHVCRCTFWFLVGALLATFLIVNLSLLVFQSEVGTATVSSKAINFGYDTNLMADQAFLIGRSNNLISNISLITQAYVNGVFLSPSYTFSDTKLQEILSPLILNIDKKPIDALFNFE